MNGCLDRAGTRSIGALSPIATVWGYGLEVLRTWFSNKPRGSPKSSPAGQRHSSAQPRPADSLDLALQIFEKHYFTTAVRHHI